MYKVEIDKFNTYLSENGLNLSQTNDYFRRLDKKVFVNPAIPEHKEVEKHVCGFVEHFLQELHRLAPGLKLEAIKSGSYFSHLRVGKPYEFDFMLEIPTPNVKVRRVENSVFYDVLVDEPQDFMWIEKVCPVSQILYDCSAGQALFVDEFRQCMISLFQQCLGNLDSSWNCIKYGYRSNCPAYEVILIYQDNAILLDLVPCIRFPLFQQEEVPDMNKELYDLVYQIIKKNPESLQHLNCNKSDLTKLPTKENIPNLVQQTLYLVFSDELCARLSTSIIEQFVFLATKDEFLSVLRLVKYFIQTFHIPVTSYMPWHLDRFSEYSITFGLSSAIQSRFLTMFFLKLLLSTPFEGTQQTPDEDLLSCHVFSVLLAIQHQELYLLKDRSLTSIFPGANNDILQVRQSSRIHDLFHAKNMATIVQFILKSINENSMEQMCLASVENHVKCEGCWEEDMDMKLQIYNMDVIHSYPEKLCYMHEYLNSSQYITLPSIKENSTDKICLATVDNHVKCEECWEENMDIRLQCYDKDVIQS